MCCIQSPPFLNDYPGFSHISCEGNTWLQSNDEQLTEIWASQNQFWFYCFLTIKKENILISKYFISAITEGKCNLQPHPCKTQIQGHMTADSKPQE